MKSTKRQKRTTALLAGTAVAVLLAGGMCSWAAGRPGRVPGGIGNVAGGQGPVAQPAPPPRVDVAFVLDTTGSMSGLIDGAKRKIWAIANRVVSGQPRPDVRLGLVAYRDRGDAYVTKMWPLTKDIDVIQEALMGLEANGGGDTPEHVNQALADGVRRMQWDGGGKVLRLLFLVGDAPPHEEYDDGLSSRALAREAAQKGIIVNTIRCGSDHSTARAWTAIASEAGGRYASIAQDGGVVAIATPFDDDLHRMNEELADTVLTFGTGAERATTRRRLASRKALAPAAAAEAASFSAKAGRLDSGDLLTAMDEGKAELEALPAEALPEPMKRLDKKGRKAFVKKHAKHRKGVKARIMKKAKQREAWLAKEEKKRGADKGFDSNVVDMLRNQAAGIGVAY